MNNGSATEAGELLVDLAELKERLSRELALTDWRAIVAVVVAEPGLGEAIDRARRDVLEERDVPDDRVVTYDTRLDEAGRACLSEFNRARDSLLGEKRLIWLQASSAADVRFIRATAPDLLAAIDLFVELRLPRESDWATCRQQLCKLMEEQHGLLDFTGLLPASMEQRKLPLSELYQPLVDLESAIFRPRPTHKEATLGYLVLGHPGTGKTTFVRHLAWTYARQAEDPLKIGPKVPLLLPLSDYGYVLKHDRVLSLVDYLPRWLENHGISGGTAVTDHLREVVLLLDGLDGIRSTRGRRAILDEARDLLQANMVGAIVVTGRSFLVDELHRDDNVLRRVFTRAPKPEQIHAFLRAFTARRRGKPTDVQKLIDQIDRDPDLQAMARTPLILAFMAILDELEGRLPDRRVEIYYRLVELLINRSTRARRIGTREHHSERPTRADAMRVLGPLAWLTVRRGERAMSEIELTAELHRIESQRATTEEASRQANALLDLLRSDAALLVSQDGRWSFVHGSIGDYLAGSYVERDRERWAAIVADPFRAEWREVVIFCAGQLGIIEGRINSLDELINAIVKHSRHAGHYKYPSLLMGLLEESPGLSRLQSLYIVHELLEIVFTSHFSHEAAFHVQFEFSQFLTTALLSSDRSIFNHITMWFVVYGGSIRWDRLLNAGRWQTLAERPSERTDTPAGEIGIMALGTTMGTLRWWAPRYSLDLTSTLEQWRNHRDWRFRLAAWLVDNSEERINRPFSEIAPELGIELS